MRAVARERRSVVDPQTLAPQVLHYSIPALEETGRPVLEQSSDIKSQKLLVQLGDVLVGRLNPRKGRVVRVVDHLRGATVASTEFVPLVPFGVEQRFLTYVLQAETSRQMLDARVQSVTRSHQRVEPEFITHMNLPMPTPQQQRRVADFLDDQLSRIDELVALRERQSRLVSERLASALEDLLVSDIVEHRRLDSLTDAVRPIQYGIVLPGPDIPGGVPIVKGGDVAAHRMSLALLQRTSPEIDAACPRSRLVPGDLLMAIRGSVGELATVPPELRGANITQDAARIAPKGCDPTWLRWVLQTPTVQSRVQARVAGATVRGINIGDLRRLSIPFMEHADQRRAGAAAEQVVGVFALAASGVRRGIELLEERRRALITAAVTGEFDVSTASTRAAEAVLG